MQVARIANVQLRNVLIIEDDEADFFLLTNAMNIVCSQSNIQIQITHKKDGFEALNAVVIGDLKSELFDTLVVDLNMPVMNGLRFLRVLRGEFNFANTRAVVLTTAAHPPIRAAAREAGADEIFVKPSSQSELIAIVRKILIVE